MNGIAAWRRARADTSGVAVLTGFLEEPTLPWLLARGLQTMPIRYSIR
jgi:hypothetical protein